MQKALVVMANIYKFQKRLEESATASLAELNRHLAEGWRVAHVTPMSGTDTAYSLSLVILERDG